MEGLRTLLDTLQGNSIIHFFSFIVSLVAALVVAGALVEAVEEVSTKWGRKQVAVSYRKDKSKFIFLATATTLFATIIALFALEFEMWATKGVCVFGTVFLLTLVVSGWNAFRDHGTPTRILNWIRQRL